MIPPPPSDPAPQSLDITGSFGRSPDSDATDQEALNGATNPSVIRSPQELFWAVIRSVGRVLYCESDTLVLAAGCLLAGGHLLVEDFPGLGKTTLAKALARSLGVDFKRIQFTADLLPSDITGAMILEPGGFEPKFRPGPIFANLVMADELNRASARAQSALLEAMEESQVSVDGTTMRLPSPFMVVATQNPHDAAGTAPLPHGQRDRFLMRVSIGYPSRAHEEVLLNSPDPALIVDSLSPAITDRELASLLDAIESVYAAPALISYLLDLVHATRTHESIRVGASPRATLALLRASRALAVAGGRNYALPQDVQGVAPSVLSHRILLHDTAGRRDRADEILIDEILHSVPVPVDAPTAPASHTQ